MSQTKYIKRNGVQQLGLGTWIPKILPATAFSFCPDGHILYGTISSGPSTILMPSAPFTQQAANYHKLLGQKYNKNSQRILTCIFEGTTTHIFGFTFILTCSPQYIKWFEQRWHNRSNIMPSPATHVASNQSSQLEHPSCFSNPAQIDDSNPQLLHLNPSPLIQWVAGGIDNHPFSASPPQPLPPHINSQALIYMLHTFFLPLPLPLTYDPATFCS